MKIFVFLALIAVAASWPAGYECRCENGIAAENCYNPFDEHRCKSCDAGYELVDYGLQTTVRCERVERNSGRSLSTKYVECDCDNGVPMANCMADAMEHRCKSCDRDYVLVSYALQITEWVFN